VHRALQPWGAHKHSLQSQLVLLDKRDERKLYCNGFNGSYYIELVINV
jgi:hypothetical protein